MLRHVKSLYHSRARWGPARGMEGRPDSAGPCGRPSGNHPRRLPGFRAHGMQVRSVKGVVDTMKTSPSKKLSPPRWRHSFALSAVLLLGLGAGCGKSNQVRQPETTPAATQVAGEAGMDDQDIRLVAYEFILVPLPLPAATGTTAVLEQGGGGVPWNEPAAEESPVWGRSPGTEVSSMDVLEATGLVQPSAAPAGAVASGSAGAQGDEQARRGAAIFIERVTLTRGTPSLDQAERIAGNQEIELTEEARRGMNASELERARARVRLCMAESGVPVSADIVESSGFPSLDDKLRQEMMGWRYRPQRVDGALVPFCEQVTFRYRLPHAGDTRPVI